MADSTLLSWEGRGFMIQSFAFVFILTALSCVAASNSILIVGGPQPLWPQIISAWHERFPDLAVTWQLQLPSTPQSYSLVFAYYPVPQQISAFSLIQAPKFLAVPEEFIAPRSELVIDSAASKFAATYLDEGGIENGIRLLSYLYSLIDANAPMPQPATPAPRNGIYHPATNTIFSSWSDYHQWWEKQSGKEGRAVVAINFFTTLYRSRDLDTIDALIRELEAADIEPLAVFGYPLNQISPLIEEGGLIKPRAVIALNTTLSSPKDAEIYQQWGVPVLNGLVSRESFSDWKANPKGLPSDRLSAHLSLPERSGLIAPTLVATSETKPSGIKLTQPFKEGISAITSTALRMLALQLKPNSNKRIALIYFNNPPGKGNIGASYLQVFPSIEKILATLDESGYQLAKPLPDSASLQRLLESGGRNLETWARGEKRLLSGRSNVIEWPVSSYLTFYNQLPKSFRDLMEASWGPPGQAELMTEPCGKQRCFLFPVNESGNILLAPQPLRSTFARVSSSDHDTLSPPPHQYVAFYLWLRLVWKADAFLHLGRHGTIEWLPGKQTALDPSDAPPLLLGDVPNFNIYVMDGGGEAIQAKRRGGATLISHLTPLLALAGPRADLGTLHEAFHQITTNSEDLSPALLADYERTARKELKRLHLYRQLHLNPNASWAEIVPVLHRFLHEVEDAPVPLGLPVFGVSPTEEQIRDAAAPESVRQSGPNEVRGLLAALEGRYIPSRLLGDPLRKPDALPTGGNLHSADPTRIPTEAAWRAGQEMAKDFIAKYQQEHHKAPQRISLVLWYGETERHQGSMECMALALLGVRPIWNTRGIVEELQLIPSSELGRPRIDVVFTASGNYRDGFPDKIDLLNRAVKLAAQAPESEIAVHNIKLARQLESQGIDPVSAAQQAQHRIFSSKPGTYGVGVQSLVEQSGGVDSSEKIAALYLANISFAYGGSEWGVATTKALRENLRSIDAVQFSRSSNLYGSLDNDDTYQYVGGLRTAVQMLSGHSPDIFIHNLRKQDGSKLQTLREWLAIELHSRHFNPKWLEGMKSSGYAGARQLSREVEHLYGFQKTTPEHVDPSTWQTVLDVVVNDKYKLGLKNFFAANNPHARQTLLARLLEVDRQQIYAFSKADQKKLIIEYAASVATEGAACNAQVCANKALQKHLGQQLRNQGLGDVAKKMEQSLGKSLTPPKAPEPRKPLLSKTKSLESFAIAWVRRVRVHWDGRSIPSWVWGVSLAAYLLPVLGRLKRRHPPTTLVLSNRDSVLAEHRP